MEFDLGQVDALLSTTRAVRKRLDLERAVPDDVLLGCLQLAVQAPTGSNRQGWRWMVVRDAAKKEALAEMYNRAGGEYLRKAAAEAEVGSQIGRVMDSATFLAENLARVPVMVIPLIIGRVEEGANDAAGLFGSIIPAMWSFQLALRSRGLGSCYTTIHLRFEQEAADLLGIPAHLTQAGLLPVAYTKGTDFRPAARAPVSEITYLDTYKNPPGVTEPGSRGMPEYFLIESEGPVTTITFNRPEKRNGLNGPVMAELEQLIHRVRDDRSARALILTGAGSTFCAGADPTAVTRRGPAPDPAGIPANPRVVGRIFDAIAHLDVMTIGAINGHAIGGGWSFALAVDYCIAVPEAQFWVPEVDLGTAFRGLSSFALTARMGPWLAKEAAILCRRFGAEELRDLRVINRVVPPEELMPTARRMAAEFAAKAPKAATGTKRDINSVVYGPRYY